MASRVRQIERVTPPDFDAAGILRILVTRGVRFVVIGGTAGNLLGSTTVTHDIDICYARDAGNLEALAAALRDLEVSLRGADPGLPFKVDARTLRIGLNFTFDTRLGPFDCLGETTGGFSYELLQPNIETVPLSGIEIPVCSLDDLIRMRRAAGRIKDLVDMENLSALRDVRRGRLEEPW
jgi:hypothetical protein